MKKYLIVLFMLNKVILCAQIAPVFHWAKGHGGIDYDDFKGVCMDAVGNVYITGTYTGTIDFDPGPGVYTLSTIYRNVFITKLDVSGSDFSQINDAYFAKDKKQAGSKEEQFFQDGKLKVVQLLVRR